VDNATHSLVGLLVADALWLTLKSRAENRGKALELGSVAGAELPGHTATDMARARGALRLLSVVANNLCDLDISYATLLGGKLGYLLHHRGHTHTLPVAIGLGLALFALAYTLTRRSRRLGIPGFVYQLLVLSLAGPVVHMSLDALNSYGVHPFWPLNNRWYYGDSLFIVEPWLWVFGIPAVLPGLQHRVARWFWHAVLLFGLVLCWVLPLVPWPLAIGITALGYFAFKWFPRQTERTRVVRGGGLLMFTIALYALAAVFARMEVRRELARGINPGQWLDVILTPAPGNPLCHSVVTVEQVAQRLVLRAGSVSLLPSVVSPKHCATQDTGLTLGLTTTAGAILPNVAWQGQWSGAIAEWRRLQSTQCEVAAFAHFARAPFFQAIGEQRFLIGDLRFDRDPGLDFSEFYVTEPASSCPPWVPVWTPPRSEL
jgi:inner membrane protein